MNQMKLGRMRGGCESNRILALDCHREITIGNIIWNTCVSWAALIHTSCLWLPRHISDMPFWAHHIPLHCIAFDCLMMARVVCMSCTNEPTLCEMNFVSTLLCGLSAVCRCSIRSILQIDRLFNNVDAILDRFLSVASFGIQYESQCTICFVFSFFWLWLTDLFIRIEQFISLSFWLAQCMLAPSLARSLARFLSLFQQYIRPFDSIWIGLNYSLLGRWINTIVAYIFATFISFVVSQ